VNEFHSNGDALPSVIGQREGNSRVAREGRDKRSFLVFGPYPYLTPAAGRYRITMSYIYYKAPVLAKRAVFDVPYGEGSAVRFLDRRYVPFIDNARHELTREIVVPEPGGAMMQVRVLYLESGDLAIDSLDLLYLGK
jgi:hypothetical protein